MIRLLTILGLGGLAAYAYHKASAANSTDQPGPPATRQQAVAIYNELRTGSAIGRPVALAGVPRGRRLPQGYVGTSMLNDPAEIRRLYAAGVRCIVSLVQIISPGVLAEIQRLSIRHWTVPMGKDFLARHTEALAAARAQCGPRGMAVHCTHGVDRTGASLAWLLWRYDGFTPQAAMWANVDPGVVNTGPLLQMFRERGLSNPPGEPGMYAPARVPLNPCAFGSGNCGFLGGGMKVHNADYQHQADTVFRAMGVQ